MREIAAGEGIRAVAFAPKTREVCVGGEGGVHLTYFFEDGKRNCPSLAAVCGSGASPSRPTGVTWRWAVMMTSIAIIQTKTNEITKEITKRRARRHNQRDVHGPL